MAHAANRADTGTRVRQARRAQGLTQLQLAERLGRSESWVRGVERGRLILDRRTLIDELADILRIDVAWLLGQPYEPRNLHQDAGHQHVPALRIAIRRSSLILSGHPGIYAASTPRTSADLRRHVDHVTRLRQAADLPAVMAQLPILIEDINTMLLDTGGPALDTTQQLLVETSHIARMVLNQLGHHDLAWTAVENAATAATRLGDDLVQASSAWDRCGVLLHTGSLTETISVAEAALNRLDHQVDLAGPVTQSMWGALHLRCAIAASRNHDATTAWQHLAEAETAAARLNTERNDFQTVFGPTNVQIHAVEIAVELGQPDIALTRAQYIDTTNISSKERIVHHGIDMARAYGQAGQDTPAVRALKSVARISPHYVHNHPMARALTTQLLQRSQPGAIEAGLAPIAHAMNL